MNELDSPTFAGRLTKKVLAELPQGSFLQSNICRPDKTPLFADVLGPTATREELWVRLPCLGRHGD